VYKSGIIADTGVEYDVTDPLLVGIFLRDDPVLSLSTFVNFDERVLEELFCELPGLLPLREDFC
jgi:hypothetical protein